MNCFLITIQSQRNILIIHKNNKLRTKNVYDKAIKQYFNERIVEYVDNNNKKQNPEKCIICPQRIAIRENNETAKLRIVLNTSSKGKR